MGGEVERKERRTSSIGQRAWHSPSPRAKKKKPGPRQAYNGIKRQEAEPGNGQKIKVQAQS